MTRTSTKSQVKVSTLMPLLMLIINLGTVAVVWFGGQQISQGVIQVGDMMALIQYLMLIMYALVMMSLIFCPDAPRQRMRGAHYGGAEIKPAIRMR